MEKTPNQYEKPKKHLVGNAFREMIKENIRKKRASGEPFTELEKAFIREEQENLGDNDNPYKH